MRLGWKQPATTIEASLQGQPLSIMEFESPSAALIAEPVPLASRSSIWWVSALMFTVVLIFAFAPVDIVVSANGKVVSASGIVVIQPLDQSIIKTINVRVGQVVRKGDLLATLDPQITTADVVAYQTQVAQMTPEIVRLTAEKDNKQYVPTDFSDPNQMTQLKAFQADTAQRAAADKNYNQQIAQLEQEIAGNLAQAEYYRQRLGISTDVETLRRQEEQLQVGSKLNSLEAADTRVSMEASMDLSIANAQAEKEQLKSVEGQRDADDAAAAALTISTLTQTQQLLATAQDNLSKSNVHSSLVEMRSPNDAVVIQVEKLSVGSVLQPGDQFIQLSPLDRPLEVEAYISGTDIGWVLPGDYVQIKFDTYMYQEYGDARGHVVAVTADSFVQPTSQSPTMPLVAPSTGSGDPANSLTQSLTMSPTISVFYVSRIAIDRMNLQHVPKDFRLIPGMPLSADIKVGWRTYLDYIFARVAPTFYEAMREP
jgi:HlyD family secretion protein